MIFMTTLQQKSWILILVIFYILFSGVAASRANDAVSLQLKWKHQFQFAGYYAAIEQGYYLEEGLDVTLIEGKPGGKEVEEVLSGRANFAVGMSDIILSRFHGKPVVLLANIFQHSPVTLLTTKKSGYTSPQDFFKKNIRMVGGIKSAELQAMFFNEGVALTDLNISTPSWNLDDLISGEVDAIAAYISSQPYRLENQSIASTLISPITYGIDFYGDNLFTSEREIAEHPERVAAFRRASLKGWKYALENPEEIVEIILSEYAGSKKNLSRDFLLNEATIYQGLILPDFVELGHTNPGRWKHIADTYVRLGLADPDYSFEGFFFQPEMRTFTWKHWSIKIFSILILGAVGTTLFLSIFNRRLRREISAHQQTEKELRVSEEKFRALFEQSGGYCMILDPNTSSGIPTIIDANEAACLMHGYSREEFIGRPVSDIDDEDGKKLAGKRTAEIMNGKPFYVENEHMRTDGTIFSVAVNAQRIDIEGKPPFILTTEYDISERKRGEKELKEREEQYRAVVENTGDYIVRYDREGRHLYANRKALERTELTEDQYIGKTHREMGFPVHLCELWEENIESVFTAGKPKNIEFDVELAGRLVTYDLQLTPEFSGDGTVQTVLGISRDITNRKNTEEKLRDSILNLKEAVKAGHIGLWNWDLQTNRVDYSTEWKRQIGYEDHEIKDDWSEWEKRVHPDDLHSAVKSVEKSIKEINQDHQMEFRFCHKDGSYRTILTHASFMLNDEGHPIKMLGSHLDITEQKRLEEKLRQAQKMESIGTLAGGIAHDFNNILSSVLGFTELALDAVEKETPIEEDLREVYTAGLRAKDLVKQILTFARQSDEVVKPIQIGPIVKEVLKFVRSATPTTIEIKDHLESTSLIMGNETQIHQIVMNLCNNGAQAMEEGGVLDVSLRDVKIDNAWSPNGMNMSLGEYVEIKVLDTGQGMESHVVANIFEPYFTTKKTGEGTGLGLAMVHGIVETYKGYIFVESTLAKGTEFTVYLPVCREKKNDLLAETETLALGKERILIVDDEISITNISSRILGRLGYSVTTSNSSIEALELFESKPGDFDLVISDVTMPHMTGDRLAQKMMQVRLDVPVILCTGYNKNISNSTVADMGVKAFVNKPIVKADLVRIVRDVLDQAREI